MQTGLQFPKKLPRSQNKQSHQIVKLKKEIENKPAKKKIPKKNLLLE